MFALKNFNVPSPRTKPSRHKKGSAFLGLKFWRKKFWSKHGISLNLMKIPYIFFSLLIELLSFFVHVYGE